MLSAHRFGTVASGGALVFFMCVATFGADLVPFGASWAYLAPLDLDSDPNLEDSDFDSTWFLPNYDTTSPLPWNDPAPEPLGYGSINGFANGFGTTLDTPADGDRYTAYFRHEFTTASEASKLALDLLTDDGSKVYLDGVEILSFNCCEFATAGTVSEFTEFSGATGNEDFYQTVQVLEGETLPAGDHVLAVAVHQANTTSSDLGFSLRLISDFEPPQPDPNAITTGIDTFLAEAGQRGPDSPHGDLNEWEWDGEDGGGQNHALLWFDIPQDRLDNFGDGTATLKLQVTNDGSSGDVHRVTADWLSGPDGGDEATWFSFPDGPGLFPGDNLESDPSFSTGDITAGQEMEFDVTDDVLAWASGVPNYGWGFFPTGTNGAGISSFESGRGPQLILMPESQGVAGDFDADGLLTANDINALADAIRMGNADPSFDVTGDGTVDSADHTEWVNVLKNTYFGDANLDGEFSSGDLVVVFQGGKFETGEAAGWETGDWDGDGVFSTGDIVKAFQTGAFEVGPRPGVAIPEPSGLLLMLGGCIGLALSRRSRRLS